MGPFFYMIPFPVFWAAQALFTHHVCDCQNAEIRIVDIGLCYSDVKQLGRLSPKTCGRHLTLKGKLSGVVR
jgi:hypothetical protein